MGEVIVIESLAAKVQEEQYLIEEMRQQLHAKAMERSLS